MNTAGIEERFTNHGYDEAIGKYFAQARFYDPATGRMMARDPLEVGLNPYLYCEDDPVNYTDPTGEVFQALMIAAGTVLGTGYGILRSIERQKQEGGRINPWEVVQDALISGVSGFVKYGLATINPLMGLSILKDFGIGMGTNLISNILSDRKLNVIDAMKKTMDSVMGIGEGSFLPSGLFIDRPGNSPSHPLVSPAHGSPSGDTPGLPDTGRAPTSRDPKAKCSTGISGYGYNDGASGPIKTTPRKETIQVSPLAVILTTVAITGLASAAGIWAYKAIQKMTPAARNIGQYVTSKVAEKAINEISPKLPPAGKKSTEGKSSTLKPSKSEEPLKFGDNDLVYGPSSAGKLEIFQNNHGGRTLNSFDKPTDMDWPEFSFAMMEKARKEGNKIHFDLTNLKQIDKLIYGKGKFAKKVTAKELRYIDANWSRFKNTVKFYVKGVEVEKPW